MQTVGTELSIVDVKIQNEQMDVKLQLLDTGGHPAQRSLVEHGLGDGHDFCCLVYSVADKASFLAVKHWHSILSARTTKPKASLKGVLVASKIDLPVSMHQVCQGCMKMCEEAAAWLGLHSSVQVQQDEGETLANELGMELILASGMRLADARRPFEQLARLIIDEYKSEVSRIEECVLAM